MKLAIYFLFLSSLSFGQNLSTWNDEKIEVERNGDKTVIVNSRAIYNGKWNSLPQPIFW